MQDDSKALKQDFGPWNPGLRSDIPRELLPLATVFQAENVVTTLKQAEELKQFCGFDLHELVSFRPKRLILHEVLIRVTADLAIYDGRQYEDLGINFRRIAGRILSVYIEPHLEELQQGHVDDCRAAHQFIAAELASAVFGENQSVAEPSVATAKPSVWTKLFGGVEDQERHRAQSVTDHDAVQQILDRWQSQVQTATNALEVACLSALHRVVSGILRRQGRLIGDADLIAKLAVGLVGNDYGARNLGKRLDPYFDAAVRTERFRRLPNQASPVVLNTKGASASGKSTMRPYQHQLVDERGFAWEDFALISPDIWRKQLLDYDSLGTHYKYAGMLCGHEVEIVDRKLDRYVAEKSETIGTPHLLIDRFRFDSFTLDGDEPVRLLTRFGDLVYMFFMVTPPAATVERAWRRGQIVGRYKAVDDLLAHNIEAYSGMPELFFSWAQHGDKRIHYEFLDNTVPLGSRPRTIAFGWNGEMNVLSVAGLLDIERFRKVNVRATNPNEVFTGQSLSPQDNTGFLQRCAKSLPIINFADQFSGRVYARMEAGKWVACDQQGLARALHDADTSAGLAAIDLPNDAQRRKLAVASHRLDHSAAHTIGAWGARASSPAPGQFSG